MCSQDDSSFDSEKNNASRCEAQVTVEGEMWLYCISKRYDFETFDYRELLTEKQPEVKDWAESFVVGAMVAGFLLFFLELFI